jgi:hypothetical protein
VYLLGNQAFVNEEFGGDFMDDYDSVWATTTAYVVDDVVLHSGTVYRCLENHTAGVFATDLAAYRWEIDPGDKISFDWELPWTDTNSRMKKKLLGYIGLDTSGTGSFTVQIYVDNIRLDSVQADDPLLSLDFVGGDSGGFGAGNQPYGGGRRAVDERNWGFPAEFKILKIRVKGTTRGPLSFSAISVLYRRGTYKR